MLIKRRVDFDAIKKLTTKEDFYNKFDVSMDVVAEVLIEEAMVNLYFEDSRMATTDEILELKKLGLL
jgi:hypothetical protein